MSKEKNIRLDDKIDLRLGKNLVEIKSGLTSARSLRIGLMKIVYVLTENSGYDAMFVLVNPEITELRILDEWNKAKKAFRPEIANRINIITYRNGNSKALLKAIDPKIQTQLEQKLPKNESAFGIQLSTPDYYYELLKILINQWLTGNGPMTADWLTKSAGCSYPTFARVKAKLTNSITSFSDRKIELRHFPRDAWAKLLIESDRVRSTMRFVDTSYSPRSPETILQRLRKLERQNIFVGGVYGAKHYYPDLDLVGNPRMDISIHCPGKEADISFIEKLDPALKLIENANQPANLIIHFIRRKMPFNEQDRNGINWADPVECLLDLHEARLESQAKDFLNSFKPMRKP